MSLDGASAAEAAPDEQATCDYCGCYVEDPLAPCPARDQGVCRP